MHVHVSNSVQKAVDHHHSWPVNKKSMQILTHMMPQMRNHSLLSEFWCPFPCWAPLLDYHQHSTRGQLTELVDCKSLFSLLAFAEKVWTKHQENSTYNWSNVENIKQSDIQRLTIITTTLSMALDSSKYFCNMQVKYISVVCSLLNEMVFFFSKCRQSCTIVMYNIIILLGNFM